ncbi:Transglutaminase-like superfamily protein [Rhizobium leguminosarum bv. trifolii WSM2297]|uniref:Transglutaminase-like superfamily protein n=1 Tax=Rhizobium leguminosarum bv. trifolii WSM2297 TaxID=754762 RepID=J0CMP0_RHILT|nr:transglutaminase domain-containing protein [Rhizobium leguminosarum]EJC83279.1 Transglutaminase-like superfamily protein [Rhizobium leguminosarum bv. trifolii WSM2297]EJC85127.1 Transglutaminase-like superfamily protein [Rhizobium leguminosarum bv. trifolii WSM2297]
MEGVARWIPHTAMTNPGRHANAIAGLPTEIGALIQIIQGVLVHSDWFKEYGLDETSLNSTARTTLPIAERLDDVFRRDSRPLNVKRSADKRSVGTCRYYALMLCSLLRCRGVPARVRCGFAAYFSEGWEDHWVCEYWDSGAEEWCLCDPQIDQMLRQRNQISFDPAKVPRQSFLSAGEAWLECRRSKAAPGSFGHGNTIGLWFVKINVVRDHYVLNGRETSSWDRWREAPPPVRAVGSIESELLDVLAASPEQPLVEIAPDW